MRIVSRRSFPLVALLGFVGWCALPGTALADPAGPTDFRTTVVGITPATEGIRLSVVGGDSFLRIEVDPGHSVLVLGYDREPYLRIGPDGFVDQNRRSYATYYNEDRFGLATIPATVDNDAEPDWERVGSGGAWAWHDHRAHWMGIEPPIGLVAGESLPDQVVPIVVDGTEVAVELRTTLLEQPSRLPVVAAAVVGLVIGLLGVLLGRASTTLVTLLGSVSGVVVGSAQWWSLPAETDRQVTWWLLPLLATLAVLAAVASYGRSRSALLALTLLAGLQITTWSVARRDVLVRAILPTDLPAGLDRGVTAFSLSLAVVVVVATTGRLFRRP